MALVNFIIALFLNTYSHSGLASFAQTIHDGFVAQIATYATPVVAMATFQTQIDKFNDAITAWNNGAGSAADFATLKGTRGVVSASLRALADYAQAETPNDTASWLLVGFKIKNAPTPSVTAGAPQNVKQIFDSNTDPASPRLDWKKPLGAAGAQVKAYLVCIGSEDLIMPTSVNAALNEDKGLLKYITTATRINPKGLPPGNYHMVCFGISAAGYGAASEVLNFNVAGFVAP